MDITKIVFPDHEHYEAAVFTDSLRWVGADGKTISQPFCDALGIAIIKLTNPSKSIPAVLEALVHLLTVIADVEPLLAFLEGSSTSPGESPDCGDPTCPVHGKGTGLDGAFGMEEYKI